MLGEAVAGRERVQFERRNPVDEPIEVLAQRGRRLSPRRRFQNELRARD